MPSQGRDEGAPRQAWRLLQTMWSAGLVGTLLIWLALPVLVRTDPSRTAPGWFLYVFIGIAASDVGVILWFRRLMRQRSVGARTIGDLTARVYAPYLVTIGVAVGPAIYGGIFYYVSGNRTGLGILCLGALVALVLSRPRVEDWVGTLPSTQVE